MGVEVRDLGADDLDPQEARGQALVGRGRGVWHSRGVRNEPAAQPISSVSSAFSVIVSAHSDI